MCHHIQGLLGRNDSRCVSVTLYSAVMLDMHQGNYVSALRCQIGLLYIWLLFKLLLITVLHLFGCVNDFVIYK